MVRLNVGDDVWLRASVDDFCGSEMNAYLIHDINISDITYITPDCLNLSGLNISFGWTTDHNPSLNECPTMLSGVLGSATTNAQGIASFQYRITQQDLDLYNANPTTFDLAACITNSPIDVDNGVRKQFNADDIIIGTDPCINSPCKNPGVVSECYGPDMWWVKCDRTTGACVQDILRQANHPVCLGATHVLELTIKPHSWYTPQSAADELITKMSDINGAMINAMNFLTGWSYVETVISTDENYVYLKVYMRENIPTLMAFTAANVGYIIVGLIGITVLIGTIVMNLIKWGPWAAPADAGLSNKNLGDASDEYIKKEIDDCAVKCAGIDPPLTQDQKASCLKICIQNELENWGPYINNIFPGTDITPLDKGRTEVQKCYDIYNSSAKTAADFDAVNLCMGQKGKEATTSTTTNIYNNYPPDAPAGVTAD